jgi:two-component system, cell cycle sensor histidine kinase and response regulator CckA
MAFGNRSGMLAELLLGLTIILQVTAVIMILRLIRITGRRGAWWFIASALSLLSIRSGYLLVKSFNPQMGIPDNTFVSVTTFLVSALVFIGISRIAPVFITIKKSEKESKENERKLRIAFDGSPDPVCIMRKDNNKIVRCNSSFCEVSGYSYGEIIGNTTEGLDFWNDPLDQAKVRELIEKQGHVWNYEAKVKMKDGNKRRILISTRLLDYEGLPCLLVNIRDVEELMQSEDALRESEVKYKSILDNTLDGICITKDGVILFCNRQFKDMYGFESIDDAIGRNVKELVAAGSWDLVKEQLRAREKGRRVISHYNFIAKRVNGSEFEVESLGSPIQYQGEKALQAVLRDVSEQRKLETQLFHAQKMESIGLLAGGIAHDFNNVLTAITGTVYLSKIGLDKGRDLRKDLDDIDAAANKAANLTRQLLAFGRKQHMEPRIVSLNEIINSMDRMLQRIIGEEYDIKTIAGEKLWMTKADPAQIEQVIVNLSVNARDAMPKGGKLTIETSNEIVSESDSRKHIEIAPAEYVMLAISDTGIGMSELTISQIFEPFYSTKAEGKGTGLGLSTVYGIVKQSGGHIWVYSEEGIGTTFKIYLPAVEGVSESMDQNEGSLADYFGNETIIVVEDDDEVRDTTVKAMEEFGYNVLKASSGQDAINVIEKYDSHIDFAITDVIMPEMNGPEFVRHLNEISPTTSVLFMSGYTENAILHEGVLVKGINYIQKPFRPISLAKRVREILDSKKMLLAQEILPVSRN